MAHDQEREDAQLDLWIREAGDPKVEPDAGHVERVRRLLLDQTETSRRPARWLRRVALLAGVGIAAAVLVALFPWPGGQSVGWAQVVEAVRARPWIHGVITAADGEKGKSDKEDGKDDEGKRGEMWYSPTMAVAASRYGKTVTFDNLRSKTRETYDPARGSIVRTPLPEMIAGEVQLYDAMLRGILGGKTDIGSRLPDAEVVDQRRREIEQDGRKWIEYELAIRQQLGGPPESVRTGELVVRVDPETRLPHSMRVTTCREDVQARNEVVIQFDYPDEGPADIYALGAPRSAKLDDRVPVGDLAQIVAANRAGREGLATYCAYCVKLHESVDGPRNLMQVSRLWRKGDRWRLEMAVPSLEAFQAVRATRAADRLSADVGTDAWWKKYLPQFEMADIAVCDGKSVYRPEGDKPETRKWKPWSKAKPLAQGLGGAYAVEGYAYPSLPVPSEYSTGTLDLHPKDGPPGTVLLTVRATRDYGAGAYHIERFWLDPSRGYVTCRHELDGLKQPEGEAAKKSAVRKDVYVMEDLKRSPKGVWYPTVVRRKNAGDPNDDGVFESDQVYRFWLDFDVEMPDTLFQPK
ncbi:MAG: hypothetical protein NTW96_03885 [Planctomycetia bacterium]|nr:hypothetical protein [Planctomycetia bacterium]